jgi:hypothetical protein
MGDSSGTERRSMASHIAGVQGSLEKPPTRHPYTSMPALDTLLSLASTHLPLPSRSPLEIPTHIAQVAVSLLRFVHNFTLSLPPLIQYPRILPVSTADSSLRQPTRRDHEFSNTHLWTRTPDTVLNICSHIQSPLAIRLQSARDCNISGSVYTITDFPSRVASVQGSGIVIYCCDTLRSVPRKCQRRPLCIHTDLSLSTSHRAHGSNPNPLIKCSASVVSETQPHHQNNHRGLTSKCVDELSRSV